jgi:phosphatidylinositol alpha-1,6-mannosyltransferase
MAIDRLGASPMKVLLLTDMFPPRKGGSGRWLWELYRRLEDASVHVVAGTTTGAEAFDRNATMSIERIPLSFSSWGVWDLRGLGQYGRATIQVSRILSRARPDVVHCGKCLPEGLIAAFVNRWRAFPFHCFVHGEELTLAGTSNELTRLTRRVLGQAAGMFANSRHTRDILVRRWGVREDRVAVMHPGVDTSKFAPVTASAAVRDRLGWSNRRVVLTVGALQKRKGQDMMIRALPAIRARCPDVLYAIAGEGWERIYLERLVAECAVGDVVQFRGVPTDAELVECYQQCDLFALPNRQVGWDFEGFGMVLLEAQACGKPVIAGQSGGTAETMMPSSTGEIVPCETPEALADVTVRMLEDADCRHEMGARARSWAVEHFDWAVLAHEARRRFAEVPPAGLTHPRAADRLSW